jgi:hypothetical protein
MPNYIYSCSSFQDIRLGILVFWAFGRGYEPLLTIIPGRIAHLVVITGVASLGCGACVQWFRPWG